MSVTSFSSHHAKKNVVVVGIAIVIVLPFAVSAVLLVVVAVVNVVNVVQVCHTSYITQFKSRQEEQCLQRYKKQCNIIIGDAH